MTEPTRPKKGPTQLGGRAPAAGATPPAAVPATTLAADLVGGQNATTSSGVPMPADVAAVFAPPNGPTVQDDGGTGLLASKLANQQPSKGSPNPAGKVRRTTTDDMTISMSSLLAPGLDPEKDLVNPGYRYPRYFTEAVRLIAFQLRCPQQDVMTAILYAGFMNSELGGVLTGFSRKRLATIVAQAYRAASIKPGASDDDE